MLRTLLFILSISATPAVAQSEWNLGFNFSFNSGPDFGAFLQKLSDLKRQPSLRNSSEWREQDPEEYRACADRFNRLYADDVLHMSFVFGYQDEKGRTLDQDFYQKVRAGLLRPCETVRDNVCGFQVIRNESTNQQSVMIKKFKSYRGNRPVELAIKLTLAYSSYSTQDERNFSNGEISRQQRLFTQNAENAFFGAIAGRNSDGTPRERCEVCIYNGHARDGGGPDFGPVPLNWRKADGSPNYATYQKHQPTYKKLLHSMLAAGNTPPVLVALLGCYTHLHFYKKKACIPHDNGCEKMSLAHFGGATGFLLSTKLSWPENWQRNFGSLLDMVMGMKCKQAFEQNMAPLKDHPKNAEAYNFYGRF